MSGRRYQKVAKRLPQTKEQRDSIATQRLHRRICDQLTGQDMSVGANVLATILAQLSVSQGYDKAQAVEAFGGIFDMWASRESVATSSHDNAKASAGRRGWVWLRNLFATPG